MKKLIAMLLALCMMASTVACSSGDNESSSSVIQVALRKDELYHSGNARRGRSTTASYG